MSHANNPAGKSGSADLHDLLTRYLQQRAADHAAGIDSALAAGDVEPYEAAPAQPVDARLALDEAVAVVRFYDPVAKARKWTAPADWSSLVLASEPAASLAGRGVNFIKAYEMLRPEVYAALAEQAKRRGLPFAGHLPLMVSAEDAVRLERWHEG